MGQAGTLQENKSMKVNARDRFYKEQASRLKVTEQWIKDTLCRYFDGFNVSEIPEYKKVLESEHYLQVARVKVEQRLQEPPGVPCQIPGCNGQIIRDRWRGKVCSVGGVKHISVPFLARRLNVSIEEALRHYEEEHGEKEAEKDTRPRAN